MRALRSRWTVAVLVPVFFLTGFGVVAALDGGSGGGPAVAPPPAAGTGASAQDETSAAAPTQGAPPTTVTASEPVETEGGEDGTGGDRAPAAPAPGAIEVDYGRWAHLFELRNPEFVPEIGLGTVTGELDYSGGADCQLGSVILTAWFYDADGAVVGRGRWDSEWTTGPGGEIPAREPLFVEVFGTVTTAVESARVRFASVGCL